MNTLQILSAAYADIFSIETKPSGAYDGQRIGDTVIDYTSFDRDSVEYDIDTDSIEAVTESGCEGCWIGIFRVRWDQETRTYSRTRVGSIKTLDEGRAAWRNMGALAGELAYVADLTAWNM